MSGAILAGAAQPSRHPHLGQLQISVGTSSRGRRNPRGGGAILALPKRSDKIRQDQTISDNIRHDQTRSDKLRQYHTISDGSDRMIRIRPREDCAPARIEPHIRGMRPTDL